MTVGIAAEESGDCAGCAEDVVEVRDTVCDDTQNVDRLAYDRWRRTPNDLTGLAGTSWTGYIETSTTLRLTIDAKQTAHLWVTEGPYPEPEAGKGFLCDVPDACGGTHLPPGAVYPIHGALYEPGTGRLRIVLSPLSPFDDWCQLQTPEQNPSGEGQTCTYALFWSLESGSTCRSDGKLVDCNWLTLARGMDPCACTAGGCFARTDGWAPPSETNYDNGFIIDLSYDEEAQRFNGSIASYAQCCPTIERRQLHLDFDTEG